MPCYHNKARNIRYPSRIRWKQCYVPIFYWYFEIIYPILQPSRSSLSRTPGFCRYKVHQHLSPKSPVSDLTIRNKFSTYVSGHRRKTTLPIRLKGILCVSIFGHQGQGQHLYLIQLKNLECIVQDGAVSISEDDDISCDS